MRQLVERGHWPSREVAKRKGDELTKSSFLISRQFRSGAGVFSFDFSELVIPEKDSNLGDSSFRIDGIMQIK